MSYRSSLLLTALLILGATSAQAQRVEITPFAGYTFGGELENYFFDLVFEDVDVEESESYGLFLDFVLNRNGQIELLYSQQQTELSVGGLFGTSILDNDVEYLHVGGLYQWTPGQVHPYIAASLGATRFSPDGFDSESRFSVSLAGGAKVFLGEHIGFRFEGRYYATSIDEDDEVFCNRNDCFSYSDGSVFTQFDVKAGIIFAF